MPATPTKEADFAVLAQGLRYRYPGAQEALAFPDFSLAAGAAGVILGPSGSGKSTLLHLLACLTPVTDGGLSVLGQSVAPFDAARRDAFRRGRIALIPQRLHLIDAVSVMDNLLLATRLAGRAPDNAYALELLGRLGVSHLAKRKPRHLSVGEAQRVAIARACVAKPALLLADEPTSALDDRNAHEVGRLLVDAAATSGAALLIVTHDRRMAEQWPLVLTLTDRKGSAR
jgi:putative ABC transport system ATP-binding protein